MQKFTRPLTREIELAGERLALTFEETGVTVRPVGSRRQPWTMSWPALLCHLTGQGGTGETTAGSPEQLAAALKALRTPPPGAPKSELGHQESEPAIAEPQGQAPS